MSIITTIMNILNGIGSGLDGIINLFLNLLSLIVQIFFFLIFIIMYFVGWLIWLILHPILLLGFIECYCIALSVIATNTEVVKIKKPMIAISTFMNSNIKVFKAIINGIIWLIQLAVLAFQGLVGLVGLIPFI